MKKLFIFTMVVCLLLVPGLALAGQNDDSVDKVVGEDIEIGEDEMKIISFDGPVVGEDIEIGEDEAKIVSIVGEDIEIGEDEAKIISIEEESSSNILPFGIGAGVLVVAAAGLLLKKKIKDKLRN